MFYWPLGGIGWVERRLALGSILKLLLAVQEETSLFCGHVPQESGTRAGGSLTEN